ncbi:MULTISPECIES: hypothetical protein [unclassified Frankia]
MMLSITYLLLHYVPFDAHGGGAAVPRRPLYQKFPGRSSGDDFDVHVRRQAEQVGLVPQVMAQAIGELRVV